MAKAVFDTRPVTKYDDDIVRRYHFPSRFRRSRGPDYGGRSTPPIRRTTTRMPMSMAS